MRFRRFRTIKALPDDESMLSDKDSIAYFKLYEKNGLDNLTQMYNIHRKMGETIREAFVHVQNAYLDILQEAAQEAVKDFDELGK